MTSPIAHFNGELLPLDEIRISPLDRGFIFGDGVYEVVPVYGRRLFRFEEHMARLNRSLAKLRIDNPHDRDAWLERCRLLVAAVAQATGAEDQLVYDMIGHADTERALIEHCRAQLIKWSCPREIEFRAELPKTPVGKLSKKELKAEEAEKAKAKVA